MNWWKPLSVSSWRVRQTSYCTTHIYHGYISPMMLSQGSSYCQYILVIFFFWYPFSSSFFDCHLTEYKTNNADHKIRLFSLWFGVSSMNNSIFSFHWLTISRFGLLSYFQLHRTHTSMSTLCMFWLQYQTMYVQESVVDVG